MSRLSLSAALKAIPLVAVAGFCLYEIHVLFQPRLVFVKTTEAQIFLSEQETRAFEQLRVQVAKNQLLRQAHERKEHVLQQKLKDMGKVVSDQKRLIQTQAHQLQQKMQVESRRTSLHQQNQPPVQNSNPVQFQQVEVQGRKLSLHPSINIVPSIPPTNSTSPKLCLPVPRSTRPATICVRDQKSDNVAHAVLKAGTLWDNNFVLNLDTVLKSHTEMGLLDIGANTGVYTMVAAAKGRNVLSVELQDTNIQLIQHSLQLSNLSSQVTIIKNAVYKDHNSKLSFRAYQNNKAKSYIIDNGEAPGTIQSVCLDDLIPLVTSRSVFMKIDVGNSEHHVLACGHEFFNKVSVKVVQMKWNQQFQFVTDQIRNFMNEHNYTANIWTDNSYQPWQIKASNWPEEMFFLKGVI